MAEAASETAAAVAAARAKGEEGCGVSGLGMVDSLKDRFEVRVELKFSAVMAKQIPGHAGLARRLR